MRPQAGVGKLKHAPPLQTRDLQWWGTLQRANAPIFSHLLTVVALLTSLTLRDFASEPRPLGSGLHA